MAAIAGFTAMERSSAGSSRGLAAVVVDVGGRRKLGFGQIDRRRRHIRRSRRWGRGNRRDNRRGRGDRRCRYHHRRTRHRRRHRRDRWRRNRCRCLDRGRGQDDRGGRRWDDARRRGRHDLVGLRFAEHSSDHREPTQSENTDSDHPRPSPLLVALPRRTSPRIGWLNRSRHYFPLEVPGRSGASSRPIRGSLPNSVTRQTHWSNFASRSADQPMRQGVAPVGSGVRGRVSGVGFQWPLVGA